jgi:cleavage and polyadenylation specificity factor subunit 2
MLTFTSLSGSARSASTTPLCYVLQVDDVRILLDCGSPDWCPEATTSAVTTEDADATDTSWETYCNKLRK